MKKKLSKTEFLCIADQIFKKSTLKYIAVVFSDCGEFVKWYCNYDSLGAAKFNANQHGHNGWTHDLTNGLQPA